MSENTAVNPDKNTLSLRPSLQRPDLAGGCLLPLQGLAVPDEDSRDFEAASSFDAVRLFEQCALAARRDGLLEMVDGHMRPTPRGRRFLNRLLAGFL